MNSSEEQQLLLAIVETWRPSEIPEYRGFRCANCQNYRNEAWYHWLHIGGYHMPIHLCEETCEKAFREGTIRRDATKRAIIDHSSFGKTYHFTDEAITHFRTITAAWPEEKLPERKAFTCDTCKEELDIDDKDGIRKGFHVWWSDVTRSDDSDENDDSGGILAELHFHEDCAEKIGITR